MEWLDRCIEYSGFIGFGATNQGMVMFLSQVRMRMIM